MPKFNKTLDELETHFDKWLYVIKNLNRLERVPDKLREKIFEKLFKTAEIAKFTPAQLRSYESSLKYYLDLKNSLDTAKDEGMEEGIEIGKEIGKHEEKIEIARNLLALNLPIATICGATGLTEEEILSINNK
jgi:predicted transposase/invertase (TIGR01784 family)